MCFAWQIKNVSRFCSSNGSSSSDGIGFDLSSPSSPTQGGGGSGSDPSSSSFDPGGGGGGGGGGIDDILLPHSWVIPLLVLAAANVVAISAFECYVLCRALACRGGRRRPRGLMLGSSPSSASPPTSRRHLFLGQMLLLGLLLGSLVGLCFALRPTPWSCAAVRLGTGFAYALIYSALLVKLVFLISLNTGVYLPATYQVNMAYFSLKSKP